jgi:hypothetical protein
MSKKKNRVNENQIQLILPSWWKLLIIMGVLITIFRIEPMIVLEAIKELIKYWLTG